MSQKYNAKPIVIDGIRFASTKEGNRYLVLRDMEKKGEITHLELQPKFDMIVNGIKVGYYKADFIYFEGQKRIVEDVKGMRTDVYKLKKKIVEAQYSIKILET